MATTKTKTELIASVLKLSDGSYSYNVLLKIPRGSVVIACTDSAHAERVERELNAAAWVELWC